ncbi:YdcF family protein [Citricoccus sp. GCM10030269]|uniref:YdcF family protein n=1 Tax=Citricoccus sp. GCM10030269 TaxID=3273388 RepID=UPI00361BA1C1
MSKRTSRPRWRRWVLRGLGLVIVVFLGIGAVLGWLTVNPRVNSVSHVDALLVLATQPGAHDEARRLAQDGVTDLLIVSTPQQGEASLCRNPPAGVAVECFSPEPATTQGEAIGGTEIARAHGVHSLGVLTFDHHIERSRLLVDRCWDNDLHMYEFQPVRGKRGYVYDFVYAMAAYGKTFLTPGCSSEPPEWLQTPIEKIKGDI